MADKDHVTCEAPPAPRETITFFADAPSMRNTFTFQATPAAGASAPYIPPRPSIDDSLARAADTSLPLAHRLSAAEDAAYRLRCKLEDRCSAVFPDFYWSSSQRDHAFFVEDVANAELHFPTSNKLSPDCQITPERDRALRDLGFVYVRGERLGLTYAEGK